jgi:hypothetical protein
LQIDRDQGDERGQPARTASRSTRSDEGDRKKPKTTAAVRTGTGEREDGANWRRRSRENPL